MSTYRSLPFLLLPASLFYLLRSNTRLPQSYRSWPFLLLPTSLFYLPLSNTRLPHIVVGARARVEAHLLREIRGDMGRYGEIRGDMGRYGEIRVEAHLLRELGLGLGLG